MKKKNDENNEDDDDNELFMNCCSKKGYPSKTKLNQQAITPHSHLGAFIEKSYNKILIALF